MDLKYFVQNISYKIIILNYIEYIRTTNVFFIFLFYYI